MVIEWGYSSKEQEDYRINSTNLWVKYYVGTTDNEKPTVGVWGAYKKQVSKTVTQPSGVKSTQSVRSVASPSSNHHYDSHTYSSESSGCSGSSSSESSSSCDSGGSGD